MSKHRIIIFTSAFLTTALLLVFSCPNITEAQYNFGGRVVYYEPPGICFGGSRIIVGPPGMRPPVSVPPSPYLFLTYFSVPFASGPITHPGQLILGKAAGYLYCYFYCGTHVCITLGGPVVLYYGSSAI